MSENTNYTGGLPIESMIYDPLMAVARAQNEMMNIYIKHLFSLAFVDGDPENGTKSIKFNLKRWIIDSDGNLTMQVTAIEAPLLAFVATPALPVAAVQINVSSESSVEEQLVDEIESIRSTSTEEKQSESNYTASASSSEEKTTSRKTTSSSEQSTKYKVSATASPQEPTESKNKISQLFNSFFGRFTGRNTDEETSK